MGRIQLSFVVLALALLAGCVTHIKPARTLNPPPSESFAAFDRYELRPVVLTAEYSEHGANRKAAAKIQEYFDLRVKPVVAEWERRKAATAGGRVLVIEPTIEQIKFISVGARIWAGPIAGSSAVVMKVAYRDKATGALVAEPEFYQRAAAMSGAFTFGGQDNAMLARIVSLVADYNARNYGERAGGTTGYVEDEKDAGGS